MGRPRKKMEKISYPKKEEMHGVINAYFNQIKEAITTANALQLGFIAQ